jgi:tRNA(fMet)-specific endonuclease VapC
MWMLDTDTCSYVLRRRPAAVKAEFEQADGSELAVSAVVLAELYYGAARHPMGRTIRVEIEDFARRLAVVPWDELAADHHGDIRAEPERLGTPLGARSSTKSNRVLNASLAISPSSCEVSQGTKREPRLTSGASSAGPVRCPGPGFRAYWDQRNVAERTKQTQRISGRHLLMKALFPATMLQELDNAKEGEQS